MKVFGVFLSLFLIVFAQGIFAQPDSLVGYWSFDKFADGMFRDESGLKNNGTTYEVYTAFGVKGKALSFNGTDSYAEIKGQQGKIPLEIPDLRVGSISLWFRVNHIPLEHGIAPILYFGSEAKCDFFDAANQGLIIELGHSPIYPENESIFYTVWSQGCTYPNLCFDSGFKITKGEWHHYVVVIDEDYNTAYFNGVEIKERGYNFGENVDRQFFADALSKQKLWLGKGHWDRTEQFFNGDIDELKIFNKALNAEEIQNIYNEVKLTSAEALEIEFPSVRVYPNPVRDVLKIDISDAGFDLKYVSLLDINGKTIRQIDNISAKAQINLYDVPEGVYFVHLVGDMQAVRKKLLVVK